MVRPAAFFLRVYLQKGQALLQNEYYGSEKVERCSRLTGAQMTAKEITDQEYVESMVKPIVDYPDDVLTSRVLDERGVLIQLTVNQADMGKVIGREGRTAKAIRSLLRVFGARSQARINLKIVEPDGGEVAIPEGDGAVPLPEGDPEQGRGAAMKKEEPALEPVKEETEKATEVI